MKSREILDLYLSKKYAEQRSEFTKADMQFLAMYSIERSARSTNEILRGLGYCKGGEQTYYAEKPFVKKVREDIQGLYSRFHSLKSRDEYAFNQDFVQFLEWYCSNMDAGGRCHCYYCNVDETTLLHAFDKTTGVLSSKKRSFNATLQIDQKLPNAGYNKDNCVMACVLCNNAKSDMISAEDFKKYIAPSIAAYWEHIKTEMSKKD